MSAAQETAIAELPHADEYSPLIEDVSRLLSREVHEGHVSPEKVREGIEAGHTIVALNKIPGIIGAGVLRLMGDKTAFITNIAVEPGYRGGGLGTKIMAQLEGVAKAKRVKMLYITPSNSRAERLYEQLGYQASNDSSLSLQKSLGFSASHHG